MIQSQSDPPFEDLVRRAEQGDAEAQFTLAGKYAKGDRVAEDLAQALRWGRLAAEQGHVSAQLSLGFMYAKGLGTPQDYGEALHWFRLSAEQGNADAQFSVGFLYYTGRGVPKDDAKAELWYRLAAEQGEVGAQLSLALMYSDQDDPEAIHWYKLAAEQGDDVAQHNLAVKLVKGDGVPQNMALAHVLFDLSAAQGNEDARMHKENLMALMTREQIAESQGLSRKWVEMHFQDGGPLQYARQDSNL